MTDEELTRMNAQYTLIEEALRETIKAELAQYPDIEGQAKITALIDIIARFAREASLPLNMLIDRVVRVYDA